MRGNGYVLPDDWFLSQCASCIGLRLLVIFFFDSRLCLPLHRLYCCLIMICFWHYLLHWRLQGLCIWYLIWRVTFVTEDFNGISIAWKMSIYRIVVAIVQHWYVTVWMLADWLVRKSHCHSMCWRSWRPQNLQMKGVCVPFNGYDWIIFSTLWGPIDSSIHPTSSNATTIPVIIYSQCVVMFNKNLHRFGSLLSQ